MKLDYNYLKKILVIMEEHPEHQIQLNDLAEKALENQQDNKFNDKFIGHIKILYDNGCFDTLKPGDLGILLTNSGIICNVNMEYRLTARGYEFLDILRNDTVFNKIKQFAISTAIEIGKNLLLDKIILKVGNN